MAATLLTADLIIKEFAKILGRLVCGRLVVFLPMAKEHFAGLHDWCIKGVIGVRIDDQLNIVGIITAPCA